jgi:hypothetical protein
MNTKLRFNPRRNLNKLDRFISLNYSPLYNEMVYLPKGMRKFAKKCFKDFLLKFIYTILQKISPQYQEDYFTSL